MKAHLIILLALSPVSALGRAHYRQPLIEQSDYCCGPRCLSALSRIAAKTDQSYTTVDEVYRLIGKDVNTPTTLYDLKLAAHELGFRAQGYACKVDDLARMSGHAIIPVGPAEGTATDPLHFILVQGVQDREVLTIDPYTLRTRRATVAELKELWRGYALLVWQEGKSPWLREDGKGQTAPRARIEVPTGQVRDFGVVDSGSVLKHTFCIRNDTKLSMKLRIVSKSCSCVSAELRRMELVPEQETTLALSLHVNSPGMSTASVVLSKQPPGSVERYTVKAFGKDSFFTMPAVGYIDASDRGIVDYPVRIVYYTDVNDKVTFERMQTEIKELAVADVVSEITRKDGYMIVQFDATLRFDAGLARNDARRIDGSVRFLLATSKGQRCIPFEVTVVVGRPLFRVTPERVFMIAPLSGEVLHRMVQVEFLEEPYPTGIMIESSSAPFVYAEGVQISPAKFMLTVSTAKDPCERLSVGMNEGKLQLVTTGTTHDLLTIGIPVSVFVRP